MKGTLFISYSWANRSIADEIDRAFMGTGLTIIRDIREIEYKDSIKDYMKKVRSTDYVLLIVSDDFLKSSSGMFEVLELLKDNNFKDKILPVIVDNTKIFKPEEKLEYIRYWTEKHKELKERLSGVSVTDSLDLYNTLKHYENIRANIGEFLGILTDMDSPAFSELKNENFKRIYKYIGFTDVIIIERILAINKIPNNEDKDIALHDLEIEYPNNSKIYFLKASFNFQRGLIKKSNYYYKKTIELDLTFGAAYFNLGFNTEIYERNYMEAKQLYEKSIEIDPNNTRAHINLAGLNAVEFGNPQEARRLLEVALQANSHEPELHFNIALLFQRDLKELKLAKEHYQMAIGLRKNFIKAKHNLGIIYMEDEFKRYVDAKEQFEEILKIDPNDRSTLLLLIGILEDIYSHYDTAKIYYDRFIKIEPADAYDHYNYADFLASRFGSRYKELARKHYEIAVGLDKEVKSQEMEEFLGL